MTARAVDSAALTIAPPPPSAPPPSAPVERAAPAPTVERAAPPSPARHAPTRRTQATGTLLVQCTPWCIAAVDDQVRGADGRFHRLTVPAGAHRVSARRLDDRIERSVEVRAGESQTVQFTFD
jgi:hypothetical protein